MVPTPFRHARRVLMALMLSAPSLAAAAEPPAAAAASISPLRAIAVLDEQALLVDTRSEVAPATPFEFTLERFQRIQIEVFDADGRHVRTLGDGLWAAGTHRLAWQREDDDGVATEPGLYRIRLRSEERAALIARN